MTDTEVEELYARYEACLGAMMTKSLVASLLRFMLAQHQFCYHFT